MKSYYPLLLKFCSQPRVVFFQNLFSQISDHSKVDLRKSVANHFRC